MQQKSRSIDISDRENYKNLVPHQPVLTSHDAGWQNLVFEHHRQPPHEMPEANFQRHILVVFLTKALAEFKMNDRFETKTLQPGDLILIPQGVDYWSADRTKNEFLVMAISPQELLHSNRELIQGNSVELIPTFPQSDPFIYGTALALKQELETDYEGCRLYAETLLNSLNIHLLRNYSTSPVELKQYSGGLSPRKLQTAIDYIQANLENKIGLDDFAQITNISPYYFCRLFKKSTGITPYQYLIKCRIEKAKVLLKQEKLSITDIALEVGFSNQSHLTKHFKRLVGVTPKKFSRRAQY
ncbi:MAG: AraC family transcriptional regulator [Pleurocapsa sp. MO_226.B13]|nr:AraC family transcriptional regulator [Pleurocapsa sp. MO_226.B13]